MAGNRKAAIESLIETVRRNITGDPVDKDYDEGLLIVIEIIEEFFAEELEG